MTKLAANKINLTALSRPVFATSPPGDTGRLFVVEQHTGKIRILQLATGSIDPTPFLQVSGLSVGNEQGLLGLAFAPDFAATGFFYVNFTDTSGATVIRRYKVSTSDANLADAASAMTIMTIPQPFTNHNGGWLAFSPKDKFLYVGTGDGGSENDPNKTSQNPKVLLGKMLRIDVTKDDFVSDPGKHYGIPTDNPFVGRQDFLPEIWALGLRNPWRCSFDRQTGDLYIGDVGQDAVEEINFQPASSTGGENYGWSLKEGTHNFHPGPAPLPALVDPIEEYLHDDGGITVIGGYVYRGSAIADFIGSYIYADSTGMVVTFRYDGSNLTKKTDRSTELFPGAGPSAISSFAEDGRGELYIMNLIPGEIYSISEAPAQA